MSLTDPQTPKKRQRPTAIQLPTPPPTDRKRNDKRTPLFLPSSPTPSPSSSRSFLHESLHLRPDGTILGAAPHPVHRATTPAGGLLQNDPLGTDPCEMGIVHQMDEYITYPPDTSEETGPSAPDEMPDADATPKANTVSPLALQQSSSRLSHVDIKPEVEATVEADAGCTTIVLWQPPEAQQLPVVHQPTDVQQPSDVPQSPDVQQENDDDSSDEIVCTGAIQPIKANRSKTQENAERVPDHERKRKRKTAEPDEASDLEELSERKQEIERRKKRMREAAAEEREQELKEKQAKDKKRRPSGKKARSERSPSSVSLREVTSDDEIECLGQSSSVPTVKSGPLAVPPRKEGVISSEHHKALIRSIIGRLASFEFSPLLLFGSRTWGEICGAIGMPNDQLQNDRARRDVAKTFNMIEKLLDNGQI